MKSFLRDLGTPGHISESVGLCYTVMHFWKFIYSVALEAKGPRYLATFSFLIKAGTFQCLMRLLERSLDPAFRLKDYNRLIAYRILELVCATTQIDYHVKDKIITIILEDSEKAFDTIYRMVCGEISACEQVMACQMVGTFSWYPKGIHWLLRHPRLVGKVGWHLWGTFDLLYRSVSQYEELQVPYMKHQISPFNPLVKSDSDMSDMVPRDLADLTTFVVLCCLCNLCAACHDNNSLAYIKPCIVAVLEEGLFRHVGRLAFCFIQSKQSNRVEKFFRLLSWCCSDNDYQRIVMKDFHSLPMHRSDSPLFYVNGSYSKSRSVVALVMTHAIHLDVAKSYHFASLAVIYLLKGEESVVMDMLRWSGDMLFDLAHITDNFPMPMLGSKPVSMKRVVMEAMLKFGASSFVNEQLCVERPSSEMRCTLECCVC